MKIVECSRDAMQGLHDFISTEDKISYLQTLLKVGFYTIDCGSYVSPRVIPQMKDTDEVLNAIDISETKSKLSVIIANISGANKALLQKKVDILGYPFSISETFQKRNTNRTRKEAIETIRAIQNEVETSDKELLIYYSMAFGNPYSDPWKLDEILSFTETFAKMGIRKINISDTVGMADLDTIDLLFSILNKEFPEIEFGAHFHTSYHDWKPKVQVAYDNGCLKFDGAIKGFGGCPMAKDELIGNMPTEKLLTFAEEKNLNTGIDTLSFESAYNKAMQVYG